VRQAEYLVVQRSGQWWVMLDGARQGPYPSRRIAIDSAVSLAKTDFKASKTARVSVDDGEGMDVLYDSGESG
jgi:hypothetical protein